MGKIRFDLSDRVALGRVWTGIQQRPYYSFRKITRGRNKGKIEVYILDICKERLALRPIVVEESLLMPGAGLDGGTNDG